MKQKELDKINFPEIIIQWSHEGVVYETQDGKIFYNRELAVAHDMEVSREVYYNHLLNKRNWIERLFNVKPSMEQYDKGMLEIKFN